MDPVLVADHDGVDGDAEKTVTAHTRAEPQPAKGGRVFHVYPPGFSGQKQEPSFTGLLAEYYTGSSSSDNFNTYPQRVQPGDTILVHAGLYKDDRYRYGAGLGTVSSGTYFLTQSGTPDKPIVIKGAGDGEPGMADRGRGNAVAASLEADKREVAGAATEIADQHQRIGG